LSDEELRKRARNEMIERMQKQLRDEGVDVSGVTGIHYLQFTIAKYSKRL
jgi:hypothetical protein